MKASYSRVSTYLECPFKYRLIYVEKLETKDDTSPTNALYIGSAIHTGIETKDIDKAIEEYRSHYDTLSSENEFEIEKIKTILTE